MINPSNCHPFEPSSLLLLAMATSPPHYTASASASPDKTPRKRRSAGGLLAFLASDKAYDSLQLAKLFGLAYLPYIAAFLLLASALAVITVRVLSVIDAVSYMVRLWESPQVRANAPVVAAAFIPTLSVLWVKMRAPPCYLVDFASFKSRDEYKLTTEYCEQLTRSCGKFTLKNMLFQLKVLLKSGLGDETYGPPWIFEGGQGRDVTKPTLASAREEMELMMFGALDELLLKTGLSPAGIDFLIVNVSMFYPAPSLASHLVNHYKMRHDVKSYNISGMGCAAGMVGVDLAHHILRVHSNSHVVIVGSENISLNWYFGNDKSMLVTNCLFRTGSYALLLSNKREDRKRSKFELVQSVRTTTGASDSSCNAIVTREDDQGLVGTSLSINLLDVASQAITISMMKLLPYNMPFSELLKFMVNAMERIVFKKKVKPYLPNFKKAFNHFCLHPGGKAVIDGVGKTLGLSDYDMEPARMTLHRFGNTSSSGLWYALAYIEAKERLKKGDKVWQVALGSGFKCNSVVWRVLRDVKPQSGCNPWLECIDRYPVEISDTVGPSHKYYNILKLSEGVVEEEKLRKLEKDYYLENQLGEKKQL